MNGGGGGDIHVRRVDKKKMKNIKRNTFKIQKFMAKGTSVLIKEFLGRRKYW